jgi:D-serine deaminase-like pyridoxal phosphate-dependent protein
MKTLELDTPVLLIDSDALDRNIARMKDMTAAAGVTYRPHAKTHKSAVIAAKQIDAGAVGVCCAKLGEAEVMAAAGIDNILITTAVIGESKIFRLLHALNSVRIAVVADNEDNINMLGRMAQLAGQQLDVIVEVDIGQGRCGVPAGPEAARLAQIIDALPNLNFAGIQGYQGKIQMVGDADMRKADTETGLDKFAATLAEVRKDRPVRAGQDRRRHRHVAVRHGTRSADRAADGLLRVHGFTLWRDRLAGRKRTALRTIAAYPDRRCQQTGAGPGDRRCRAESGQQRSRPTRYRRCRRPDI